MNTKDLTFQNISILTVILLLLLITSYFLLGSAKELSDNIATQKNKLISLKNELKSLENFEDKKAHLSQIEEAFVKEKALLEFINFLEQGAEKFALDIQISALPGISQKDSPYKTLTFSVNAQGPFPKLAAFLEYLESAPFLTEIENAVFKRPLDKAQAESKLPNLNVTFKAFAK